ncbi:hypothetical protein E2A64_12165 [Pseudohoeflea suaedae]|uniref:Flagellar biosynthesis protein FliO n=1 Tax=Pseudohoeflea suaedae TaxID=877384 RepID=A0A4R5PL47_9HYPH|nr:flagellar biosynthetic protein FliO [Pseudohoeflea suaedae]TDH36048.1 hypothetical protein E2A64_12165 [Pseudohoeflea suaedae]
MLEDSGQTANFLVAIVAVALGLLVLFGVMWFIRSRSNSTFIRGGKNRQPRLAVLDAAPVDTRRRLVLVRRDGVEHLILIGGPTDVVIESGITADIEDGLLDRAPADNRPATTAARNSAHAGDEPGQPEVARTDAASPSAAPSPARVASATIAARNPQAEPVPLAAQEPLRDPAPAPALKPEMQEAAPVAPVREAAPATRQAAAVVAAFPHRKNESEEALDAARGRVLSPATDPDAIRMDAANGPQTAYQEFEAAEPVYNAPGPQGLTPKPENAASATVAIVPGTIRAISPAHQPVQPTARLQPGRDERSEFEAILEDELSGDFEMDDLGLGEELLREDARVQRDGDLSTVSPAASTGPVSAAPAPTIAATAVPTRDRSRDTLEDEMNKLLGDLTRRN